MTWGNERLRYARYRGLRRVSGQCLLAAACQNMKKIALLLARFCHSLAALTAIKALWLVITGYLEEKTCLENNPSNNRNLLRAA